MTLSDLLRPDTLLCPDTLLACPLLLDATALVDVFHLMLDGVPGREDGPFRW